MANRLLIIEDDTETSLRVAKRMKASGWNIVVAEGRQKARGILLSDEFDPHVIVAGLGLPDGNILDHLEDLSELADSPSGSSFLTKMMP